MIRRSTVIEVAQDVAVGIRVHVIRTIRIAGGAVVVTVVLFITELTGVTVPFSSAVAVAFSIAARVTRNVNRMIRAVGHDIAALVAVGEILESTVA